LITANANRSAVHDHKVGGNGAEEIVNIELLRRSAISLLVRDAMRAMIIPCE